MREQRGPSGLRRETLEALVREFTIPGLTSVTIDEVKRTMTILDLRDGSSIEITIDPRKLEARRRARMPSSRPEDPPAPSASAPSGDAPAP